ncbi:MAG: SpoIIE family protein phosphatase, partial [Thiothrix litoralis]
ILYSDGILELQHPSGDPMTEDDLQERLQALSGLPARQLVSQLGEQLGLGREDDDKPDDISLLIIDFCG